MSDAPKTPYDPDVLERFNYDRLETVRICSMCGREKPIKAYRSHHGTKWASKRCKNCSEKLRARKQKLLADKNARELMQMFSQQVRHAKAKNAPHISDIQGLAIEALGGLHNYVKRMMAALERAEADGKHKIAQDYYLAIARWSNDAHANVTDDFSKLTQEELEAVANEMAVQALRTELGFKADSIPVIAELTKGKKKQESPEQEDEVADDLDDADLDDVDDLGEWIDPASL